MTEEIAGILDDVFEISGRGTIIALREISGIFSVGDEIKIGSHISKILGVEMINYGSRELEKSMNSIAFIVKIPKAELVDKIGQNVYLRKAL